MSDTTAQPLWVRVPHPGYYINSVSISADGGLVAAGTFFHDYGTSASAAAGEPVAARVAAARPPVGAATGPSEDGSFGTYVWNRAGDLVLSQEFDGWQGVYWVDLAADGSVVASCGWYRGSPDYAGFIAAYPVPGGDPLLFFDLPGRGNVVALDTHARLLLAGADQGYLFVRDSAGVFHPVPATIPLSASGDSALVTALDAAGSVGLVASYQGELILFRIDDGQPVAPACWQLPNSAYLHFAALSADGRRAYAGANDGTLYAIDVEAFLLHPAASWQVALPGGAKTIYGVACSADGAQVAAAGNTSDAGTVSVFADKYRHGALIWSAATARSPNSVSLDAAGDWLALADGHPDGTPGNFYLWQAATGTLQWTYPTSDMSWPIKVAADASAVAAGSDNGSVYLFAGPTAA